MERSIAKFLKQKRKETGLTQEQFALKAGVGLEFLRKVEQEKPSLTLDNLNQCLSLFNAQLGVVLDEETEDDER
jgi:y4mF family transcriptional regulator